MASEGAPQSLERLRLRLTAWYVGTFLVILFLLGVGLFVLVTARFDADLDSSLRLASNVLANRTMESNVFEAKELAIPGRRLILFDSLGRAIQDSAVDQRLIDLAHRVNSRGETISFPIGNDVTLRAYARRFADHTGRKFVAMAVGDEIELEDAYPTLILMTAVSAFIATILVGIGGWIVARKSTEPVEQALIYMRRFMADAAHELRTPISVVRSRAEISLQRSRSADEYAEALKGIESEAARVGRIVEDLLMLARADAGERPIERARVFLDDVTLDAAEAARALAARKSVRVDVDEFEEAPVLGDAMLLRQLAMILLDNAIKFSPPNATVHVAVHHRDAEATLVVADEGSGIPPEQLPRVFERFYRGDTARTRAEQGGSEGTGLGLSIARWIVDEHKATIHLESRVGEGTRAIVTFPALSAAVSLP